MERRLCYISRNYKGRHSAGNKAKGDYEDIVAQAGAHNLGLRRTYCKEKILAFLIDLAGIVVYTLSVRKDDVVFLQYPIKKYFSFICRIARWRGASTVAFIHDLGSFRRKRFSVKGTAPLVERRLHNCGKRCDGSMAEGKRAEATLHRARTA